MIKCIATIPKEKIIIWKSLFENSGGRFLSNPIEFKSHVNVSYMFESCQEYQAFKDAEIQLLHLKVRETVKKVSMWKKMWKKIKKVFG